VDDQLVFAQSFRLDLSVYLPRKVAERIVSVQTATASVFQRKIQCQF